MAALPTTHKPADLQTTDGALGAVQASNGSLFERMDPFSFEAFTAQKNGRTVIIAQWTEKGSIFRRTMSPEQIAAFI